MCDDHGTTTNITRRILRKCTGLLDFETNIKRDGPIPIDTVFTHLAAVAPPEQLDSLFRMEQDTRMGFVQFKQLIDRSIASPAIQA